LPFPFGHSNRSASHLDGQLFPWLILSGQDTEETIAFEE
jgi:hypothetical protein